MESICQGEKSFYTPLALHLGYFIPGKNDAPEYTYIERVLLYRMFKKKKKGRRRYNLAKVTYLTNKIDYKQFRNKMVLYSRIRWGGQRRKKEKRKN